REAVRTRHVASVFPYSAGRGASMDLDHTDPYRWDGTPGQTGPDNLGPLTRGEHRAKTHGMWTLTTPHPGVFIWRAPHGHYFLCTNQGTQHLGPLPTEGHPTQTTSGSPTMQLSDQGYASDR
ncbi:MAG: HNH endonuclease, partial [Microlunatus sp.]|nr:HNH endonuclease [Microlunatus sp.]